MRYQAIRQYWTGNIDAVVIHYETHLPKWDTRKEAINDGLVEWGHDDFNIAVWEGDVLVSWDWMDEPIDEELEVLAEALLSGNGLALVDEETP